MPAIQLACRVALGRWERYRYPTNADRLSSTHCRLPGRSSCKAAHRLQRSLEVCRLSDSNEPIVSVRASGKPAPAGTSAGRRKSSGGARFPNSDSGRRATHPGLSSAFPAQMLPCSDLHLLSSILLRTDQPLSGQGRKGRHRDYVSCHMRRTNRHTLYPIRPLLFASRPPPWRGKFRVLLACS